MWRATGKERAAIIDRGIRGQEAIDELGQGISGGNCQLGRDLLNGLEIIVDDGLTRHCYQVASLLGHIGSRAITQRYGAVGGIFCHYWQGAKGTEAHACLLFEVSNRNN